MKSIVIGAGKVGFSIIATLCREGYNVTAIDNNRQRLQTLEEYFDINTIEGNGAQISVLQEAGISDTDLLVAVTDKDELNMMACFIAKSEGAEHTIARVRDPDYSDFANAERMRSLGIDMLINPELVTAQEINKLINYPEADYVGFYGGGKALILELRLPQKFSYSDIPLKDIRFPSPCIFIGLEHEGSFTIPRGDDTLSPGDSILLLANSRNINDLEHFLGIPHSQIRDIVIMGGDLSGYYLAKMLEKRGRRFNIRLIDDDMQRCEEIAEDLTHTMLINSNSFNLQLFEDENIGECDAFIAVAEDDRDNLFNCVLAKNLGAKKTVAQIRNGDFITMVERAGIDVAISPRSLTADAILRFISRYELLSLTSFEEKNAQIIELAVPFGAKAVGKKIMELNFPRAAIICMIVRNNDIILPTGMDYIKAADRITMFAMPEAMRDISRLFEAEN